MTVQTTGRTIEHLPLASLVAKANPRNPKDHPLSTITESVGRFGYIEPAILDGRTGLIISGHGRTETLANMEARGEAPPEGIVLGPDGGWMIPVVTGWASRSDTEAGAALIALNRTTEMGGWVDDAPLGLLDDLMADDPEDGLLGVGYGEDEITALRERLDALTDDDDDDSTTDLGKYGEGWTADGGVSLNSRFVVPPFTVLNARAGYWQDRKREWLSRGIQSELGRGVTLPGFRNAARSMANYQKGGAGHDSATLDNGPAWAQGTSVFDPVLCEIAYRWFSPVGGHVYDPFAGGSVRGVLAGLLRRRYTGIELREEQVEANRQQGIDLIPDGAAASDPLPAEDWPVGTSTPVERHGGHAVKRDDLYTFAGQRGGKVRTCLTLARAGGGAGLVTASSRHSPQALIVSAIGQRLGLPVTLHIPEGAQTEEMAECEARGATIVRHAAGYNTAIVAAARRDIEARPEQTYIPFGMECAEAVTATAGEVQSFLDATAPDERRRIVIPVGSGMSAAGLLAGLAEVGDDTPVLGVVVGADPVKRLDHYAPGWRDRLTLVPAGVDYSKHVPDEEAYLGDLHLDPVYEAKVLPHLQEGDALWVVGHRGAATVPGAVQPYPRPTWITGDSLKADALLPDGETYDLVFSCPPYADLEVYSDDPADISNMAYEDFLAAYREIIRVAVDRLAPNRFAVWVVGEVRDKSSGVQRGLIRDTIAAFEDAGADFWNEAILLTAIATLPMRTPHTFPPNRKMGRCHQNVLVFVKGDPSEASKACGPITVEMPEVVLREAEAEVGADPADAPPVDE